MQSVNVIVKLAGNWVNHHVLTLAYKVFLIEWNLSGGLIIIRKAHEGVPMSGVAFMKKKVMVVIRL